ncbi:MAG: YncE family protein [Chlamydiales bacterium]|nr:YncE family protein [Chlamydiales bacterium]
MKFYYLFFCIIITKILSASPFIWAPDQLNNRVLVIDAATNTIFQTIPQSTGLFDNPLSVAITPDNQFAYVFNATSGSTHTTVSVINTANYQLEAFIDLQEPSTTEGNIAISPNGAFAYVTNTQRQVVSVIDTSTNSFVQNIGGFSEPIGLAFSPNSAFAYVVDFGANQVFRINTSTHASAAIPFPGGTFDSPEEIAITANGVFAYVTNFGNSTIPVLNLVNNTILTTINLPALSDPEAIVLSPDGTRAYVAGYSNPGSIFTIDTLTNTLIGSTTGGGISFPTSLAVAPSGNILYIGNNQGPILALNTGTNTIITTVPNTAGDFFFSLALQQSSARPFARPSNRR